MEKNAFKVKVLMTEVVPEEDNKFEKKYYSRLIYAGPARVEYIPGEFVSAPKYLDRIGHGLFVYKDIPSAIRESLSHSEPVTVFPEEARFKLFKKTYESENHIVELWWCEVRDPLPLPGFVPFDQLKNEATDEYEYHGNHLHSDGTETYKAVKIIRQISIEEIVQAWEEKDKRLESSGEY